LSQIAQLHGAADIIPECLHHKNSCSEQVAQ